LWGLSFKPDTDDMREAPSLVVIERLIEAGATVRVFDPVAMEESKRRIGNIVQYCNNIYDSVDGADAVALLTEWKQFRLPSWTKVKGLMKEILLLTEEIFMTIMSLRQKVSGSILSVKTTNYEKDTSNRWYGIYWFTSV
jgi:Predicted UDP-glucose 6-dehydrogenase